MRSVCFLVAVALATAAWGAELACACDPSNPESLRVRQCSLCNEAEKHPASVPVFFLKDSNPRKANRWLALPRQHLETNHHLHDMTAKERTDLWNAAIAKAKELWGDNWGIAYNGAGARTQCHTHLHIGKFIPAAENSRFITVNHPSQIPAPKNVGLWIHPVDKKLHVHAGEQITETVLLR